MLYPAAEVAKPLTRVVEDLLTGRIKVKDIYDKAQQTEYIDGLRKDELPDPATKLKDSRPLNAAEIGAGSKPKPKPRDPRTKNATDRTTLFSAGFRPKINSVRVQHIYHELAAPEVAKFPNTVAVMLRVFVELSVDLYIEKHALVPDMQRRNIVLAQKLKQTAAHLNTRGKISELLKAAIEKVADKRTGALAASVPTFHLYVHNPYAFPNAHDLKLAWDELQPFMEALWADMPD